MTLPVMPYFQPSSDKSPNKNDWHAYALATGEAICGTARINYNRDISADFIPRDEKLHSGCQTVLDKQAADEAPAEPKAKKKK